MNVTLLKGTLSAKNHKSRICEKSMRAIKKVQICISVLMTRIFTYLSSVIHTTMNTEVELKPLISTNSILL